MFLKEGYLFEWVTESTGILHVEVSFYFPVPLCKLIIVSEKSDGSDPFVTDITVIDPGTESN